MFIAMAYYEGENLEARLDRGPLTLEEALDVAIQTARGLSRAGKAGIVHRDIKPANLLVADEGVVKILDFGLAKLATGSKITKPGTRMGTAPYMSPEQVEGDEVDHRTEAVVLFPGSNAPLDTTRINGRSRWPMSNGASTEKS